MTKSDSAAELSPVAVGVLAVVAGAAIANNFALQPGLSVVAKDLGASVAAVASVASSTMIGYLVGLAILVPLVDLVSPRVLITLQLCALAGVLALAAVAPSITFLVWCFIFVGAATTVAAQSSAVVGKYVDANERARNLSVVSAGVSAGILLSRFVGGTLTQWYGWRGALLTFSGIVVLAAIFTWAFLPKKWPASNKKYLSMLRHIPALLLESALLRRHTSAGMLWFFSFNLIWVGLALRLAAPPYSLDAQTIGTYSLAGVLGLVVTRWAGRFTDRFGARVVMVVGLIAAATAASSLVNALGNPALLAVALAVFDAGCFAAQVANQASVVAICPERAGTLSAAYLTLYYAAGAAGMAAAGFLILNFGWTAIALTATLALIAGAIISTGVGVKR